MERETFPGETKIRAEIAALRKEIDEYRAKQEAVALVYGKMKNLTEVPYRETLRQVLHAALSLKDWQPMRSVLSNELHQAEVEREVHKDGKQSAAKANLRQANRTSTKINRILTHLP